jgi:ATP-dependent DNA ligase
LRDWPLIERKRRLRHLIPSVPTRLLYVDHIKARGKDFFEVACAHDFEGIVAKPANGRYHADWRSTNWIKIKNARYTQMMARHELLQCRRGATLTRRKVPLLALCVAGEAGARWLSTRCPESLGRQPLPEVLDQHQVGA